MKAAGAGKGANAAAGSEANGAAGTDSFNKHYNKELKVSEGKQLNRKLESILS